MSPDGPRVASSDTPEPARIPDARPRPTPLYALLSGWLLGTEAWLRSHGGKRLRNGIRFGWGAVGVVGLLLIVGPVINKPLTLEDITSSASGATDRWIARTFSADYLIDRADDGHLTAVVEERIDAVFPEDVDESGIQRVLPTEYQGHALDPSGFTATLDGQPLEVGTSSTPDRLTIDLDAGERLRGDHEFVLRYDLANLAYPTTDEADGAAVDWLEWDVFGPSWPQGFAGLEVNVTLPEELDDRLIRQPRADLAWTLVSGGTWLEPEEESPDGRVTYGFTNDQNTPPHAQARFSFTFQPGTFTMPPPTPLFLVQSFGPLVPLAILAVLLLLSAAARAVAWSDARGRPWYVARDDPPELTAGQAAQVLGAPAALELAQSLETVQGLSPRPTGRSGRARRAAAARAATIRERLLAAALVARRTGRLGDRPRAWARYLGARERRSLVRDGLRRIPRGFVRDLFIAAPIALTLVQWGLVRQLSFQATVAVVWWPLAFVVVSTLLAAVVLWAALGARPLTRKGALLKQHLLGVGVFARQTVLLDRGPVTDRLMPYAVLLAGARDAGRRVVRLAEGELGEPGASRRWRTPTFLTWPRLMLRALCLLVVGGSIALVTLLPNPYERHHDLAAYDKDVPGTLFTEIQSFDATATLDRGPDGAATLRVEERMEVTFTDESWHVPQFALQWPATVDGQDLGLVVEDLRVDGRSVPFVAERDGDTLLARTTMREVHSGAVDVSIDYTLRNAAFAAETAALDRVDRVRWSALIEGWESAFWKEEGPVLDPLRIEFRMSEELAALADDAGWLSRDTSPEEVRDWPARLIPFGEIDQEVYQPTGPDTADEYLTVESGRTAGGVESWVLEVREDEYGSYPLELIVDDLGVGVDFPAGTFAGPDQQALRGAQFLALAPMLWVLVFSGLAIVWGAVGILTRVGGGSAITRPGMLRDAVRWFVPAAALSAVIVFVWATIDMPADYPELPLLGLPAAGAALAAVIAPFCTVARRGRSARGA